METTTTTTTEAEERLIRAVLRWDDDEMIGAASDPACCDNCTDLTELRESVDSVRAERATVSENAAVNASGPARRPDPEAASTRARAGLRQAVWEATQFMSEHVIREYVDGVLDEVASDES